MKYSVLSDSNVNNVVDNNYLRQHILNIET